jgi:hypothetical protein
LAKTNHERSLPQKLSSQLTDDPAVLKTKEDVTPVPIESVPPLTLTPSKLVQRPSSVLPISSHWKVEPVA